jgi:hypothetical protein
VHHDHQRPVVPARAIQPMRRVTHQPGRSAEEDPLIAYRLHRPVLLLVADGKSAWFHLIAHDCPFSPWETVLSDR